MGPRLRAGVLPAAVLLGLALLGALYAVSAHALEIEYRHGLAAELEADARRLAAVAAARWRGGELPAARLPCPEAADLQVRVVLPGDRPACGASEARRPDTPQLMAARAAALEGQIVHSVEAAGRDYVAVTVPVRSGGETVAALQALLPSPPPPPGLAALRGWFVLGGIAFAVVALGLGILNARVAKRRVAALARAAEHLGEAAADGPQALEGARADALLAPLADVLGQAGQAMRARLERLAQQLDEREAVLASMLEGVLAVESGGRLLTVNAAAGRLFGIDPVRSRGRDLLEVVRHPGLQRLVQDALASTAPLERELTLYGDEPRTLAAHGTALRDAHGQGLGALVVLNDVTHLRRLERMRQDFVANVSHEIKTPITSIKGFVETLLDGALDDPVTARRFLEIVGRHADRLNAITEDLLNLSRIEQGAEQGTLHGEEVQLPELLRSAIAICAAKAESRMIHVRLESPPGLRARLNGQLVEQAVVNLVDNAVKYSPMGTEVRVEAAPEPGGVVIRVRDQGPGIPAEHLPRLFERFYRVDKARSRKAGGTGLGLAIVKHIAQAHGGRVDVQSRPGEGSVFTLHLPDAPVPPADD